jgi:hypothetical protein
MTWCESIQDGCVLGWIASSVFAIHLWSGHCSKGAAVDWKSHGNTAAQFTARPVRWQFLVRAQSKGTRFPMRASLHQPWPMTEATAHVRNNFVLNSGSAAFSSMVRFRYRLRIAIHERSLA